MFKLPYPSISNNVNVNVEVSEGISINGSETFRVWIGPAVYNEHSKWVQTTDGKKVKSAGKLFIFNDIFPAINELTGFATVKQKRYTFSGSRFCNPDGSVHHIELELI